MQFIPYVLDHDNNKIEVTICPMTIEDAYTTEQVPVWQTSWKSDYLQNPKYEKYAVKVSSELVALGAYEVQKNILVVHIVYMEAQPESNPTMAEYKPKYTGIGKLLISYGIKLSIDHGFAGDVIFEAKTDALARHYVNDFGAVELPRFSSSAPRFLISDEVAKKLFFSYLE